LPGRVIVNGAKGFPHIAAAGGVERFVEQIAKRLAESGVGCLVYERAPRAGWRREGRTLVRQLPFLDRKNHAHWSHSLLSVVGYLGYRRRADILHIHNIQNAWMCALFRVLGHRVVFHLHGPEWRVAKWGRSMSLFMRLSVVPMLLFADVVMTVCEESRRLLSTRFPWWARRIIHLPNGLPELQRPAATASESVLRAYGLESGRFLLYAGRLVPQKRVELIIQALAAPGSDDSLVLAGAESYSASYVAMLKAETRRCGVTDRVIFVGQLDWERLLCLYASCRALVQPSDSEGCSNTLLEAIAVGTSVICSDLPENRALLGSAGIYVARGDVAGLASALRGLENEEAVAEHRRMVAAQRRRLPSWDEIAEELFRLYWPSPKDQRATASVLEVARTDFP
jgi:glycosyltransferase involved in cell wall biosynthesis